MHLISIVAVLFYLNGNKTYQIWKAPNKYVLTLASMLLLLLLEVDRLFSFSQVTAGLQILAVSPLLQTLLGGLPAPLGGLTPRLLGLRAGGLFSRPPSSHFSSGLGKGCWRKLRFRGDEGRSDSATAAGRDFRCISMSWGMLAQLKFCEFCCSDTIIESL